MDKKIVIDEHYHDYECGDGCCSEYWTDYTYHISHEDGRTESFTAKSCHDSSDGFNALLRHLGWIVEHGEYKSSDNHVSYDGLDYNLED